jgi:agmatine deiminase
MIPDYETNKIYLSEILKSHYSETCLDIEKIFRIQNCEYYFLPNTKDVWARDYMPVQVSDDLFIEYRYDPDYLQGNWKGSREIKTYPDIVCSSIKLKTEKSDLILDGGNLVKSPDCIILTDKIVRENRFSYSKEELLRKLFETFQVDKVVMIPWDTKEKFGHADGMIRFVDNQTVLVNHYYMHDNILLSRLQKAGLRYEFLEFKVKQMDKRNWAYINFLQTKDLILLPKFGVGEDEQAFEQIEYFYPDYARNKRIAQLDMTEIVKFGGALNCITWTIKA